MATPAIDKTEASGLERLTSPCAMVIFGATGDLTKRKLVPALYNLATAKLLTKQFALIMVARAPMREDEFRDKLLAEVDTMLPAPMAAEQRAWFAERMSFVSGTFDDPVTYTTLRDTLAAVDTRHGTAGNHLYYLATPPDYFALIAGHLDRAGLARESDGRWRRVVVEKPFGEDLESARALNTSLAEALDERQIYRIDHYLGKETVQNLMIFRFANGIFEPIWNRRYVDHVQITVAETVGVEGRGGYYDTAGALRDMVQNHLFQLLALTAMEPPSSFRANAVRDERLKVLEAIRPYTREDVARYVVRGQYGEGSSQGQSVPAYRAEPKVPSSSPTETFAALRLQIDNWRWADVPFYLRTGKRLPKRVSEIAIQFKTAPVMLFREMGRQQLDPNLLIVRIQPDEGISLRFGAKVPGPGLDIGTVKMDFKYADYFGSSPSTGYETLLYDAMNGDQTLFHRADSVEAGWAVVTPILEAWASRKPDDFPNYAAMTWGPDAAVELMAREGRSWRRP